MDANEIGNIVESENSQNVRFNIYLDPAHMCIGIFVKGPDYEPLKKANVWRFVQANVILKWYRTRELKYTDLILGKNIVSIQPIL